MGTCWIAAFDPEAAREVLKLPGDEIPCALTPLGSKRVTISGGTRAGVIEAGLMCTQYARPRATITSVLALRAKYSRCERTR